MQPTDTACGAGAGTGLIQISPQAMTLKHTRGMVMYLSSAHQKPECMTAQPSTDTFPGQPGCCS